MDSPEYEVIPNALPDGQEETFQVSLCVIIPANTKYLYNICTMLDQRRRRWADVVQMLYKCFVLAWIVSAH